MYQDQIKTHIDQALKDLNLPSIDYILEHPANETFGDFSTNIALLLFPQLKAGGEGKYQNPRSLAQKIADSIISVIHHQSTVISEVSVAGPGFINFTLSQSVFFSILNQVPKAADAFGTNHNQGHEKVVVEYTDPNPFKELHIGHIYSNTVGESIARLTEAEGAKVWRADYFGDVGVHVAKAVWGMLQEHQKNAHLLTDLESKTVNDRQNFLGRCYALGAQTYESNPQAKHEIDILNTHLYPLAQKFHQQTGNWQPIIDYSKFVLEPDKFDDELLYNLYVSGRTWSLAYFETIYARLGTKFNGYYPESKVGETGYQYVINNLDKGIFTHSDGAVIFEGEKVGLHTRVFINKNDLPTYEAKELGLAPAKYADFPYTKSVIVTGNEINEYFKVLLAALMQINPQLGQATIHIGHGMVRLPEGKMSSRTGQVITGVSLLDQARDEALNIINQINPNLESKKEVADQVGIAAVKYAFLKSAIGSDVIFTFQEALSFTGNSGPYLQYTHARCRSVIEKSGGTCAKLGSKIKNQESLDQNPEESALLHWFYRYPEVIAQAACEYAPHYLCTYLYELAGRYNTFYNTHTILGSDKKPVDPETRLFRLNLTAATAQILKNGLYLLGIQAPHQM